MIGIEKKKIVVIGGGTGTFTVLRGLKRHADTIDITAIVSMADSGGSTGRLRDEFGQLPVGDARMALVALAADYELHEELLRELFLYRFERGSGLAGHNVGNLLLVALSEILGSEAKAIEAASRLLRVRGRIIPVTGDNGHLEAVYDDGVTVVGEAAIDDPDPERAAHTIRELRIRPQAHLAPDAAAAIAAADLVVIGPGDLYSSLLANCVIDGMAAAVAAAPGRLVFVTSLMERPGQTRGLTQLDTVTEITRYVTRSPDVVVINTSPLPASALARYAAEGNQPLRDDVSDATPYTVVRTDLLAAELQEQQAHDLVKRSLLRHDSDKLAAVILSLL